MKFAKLNILITPFSAVATELQTSKPTNPNNTEISKIVSQVDLSAAMSPNGPELVSVSSKKDISSCMALETTCSETDPHN
jgi:hypothetical protein